jgi:hypothetical protein
VLPVPVLVVTPVPPDVTGSGVVVKVKDAAETARPAVRFDTATLTVALDCTIGKVSVPANGVDAEVSAEILVLAIISCRLLQ